MQGARRTSLSRISDDAVDYGRTMVDEMETLGVEHPIRDSAIRARYQQALRAGFWVKCIELTGQIPLRAE